MINTDLINSLKNYRLPYTVYDDSDEYSCLEPIISTESLKYHFEGHMLKYIDQLEKLLSKESDIFSNLTLEELIVKAYGDFTTMSIYEISSLIFSHKIGWDTIRAYKDSDKGIMSEKLKLLIDKSYGNIQNFEKTFIDEAVNLLGNGWLWIIVDDEDIKIITTINAFNPLNLGNNYKILGACDLWEHSFYLDYKNDKKSYIEGIYSILNWQHMSNKLLL